MVVFAVSEAMGQRCGGSMPNNHFDPYEVAYVRGGSRELPKLRLFELIQTGYLTVVEMTQQ